MNKCSIILFLAILYLMSVAVMAEDLSKPNIIIILADDQGWGDLSTNGNTNLNTPNIDRLAEQGVVFDRFYVCPVCSPTRAELLTGRYHVRGGVRGVSRGGERLDLDETTIAQVFQQAGYATAAYGKWHNGMQPPYHPNARGFSDYYGFCSGHWGHYFSPMLEHNGAIVKGNGYLTDDFTDHGLRFIEKNKDKPFFLYLPYNTPHSPMQVPDRWWNTFKDKALTLRHRDPEKEDIGHTRAALAMCENIDWNVGRIVEKIEALGLSDGTIILYFSDNGPNGWRWNNGMKGKKGSTDEGGVRSPMIMKWPGRLKAGGTVKQIAGAIDLLPTLTDLAGIEWNPPKPLDGRSLKPLLTEKQPQWTDRMIFSHWGGRISIRTQKYRYDNDGHLFDMEEDPGQYNDVSESHPEIAGAFKKAKLEWESTVLKELQDTPERPFTVGCPDFEYTQLPARDAVPHGNIKRSNRHPNCTFFTNWIDTTDKITWDIEVLAEGDFEAEIYYTCPAEDIGAVFELACGDEKVSAQIQEPHDPPLVGAEKDRVKRIEGYVKDFRPMTMGKLHLEKGTGTLELKAVKIPGSQVMDFRLLLLRRLN